MNSIVEPQKHKNAFKKYWPINTFDFDGVIYMGPNFTGMRPCLNDIIITGRPISEMKFVNSILAERDIKNYVMFNPTSREHPAYSRECSGRWKSKVLTLLKAQYNIGLHYEDDKIQSDIIQKNHPDIHIIHINHGEILEY